MASPTSDRGPRLPAQAAFNFTAAMRLLCHDLIETLPELQHIRLQRVAITFSQARKRVNYGLFATLTPMNFAGGRTWEERGGVKYRVQQILNPQGVPYLYVLSFYLPRFLDLDFQEKLVTVLHELWHISPHFDGDLRRFPGRCYVHSHSEREYDRQMEVLARRYLAAAPPDCLPRPAQFLQSSYAQLLALYGAVGGHRTPNPKLIACSENS